MAKAAGSASVESNVPDPSHREAFAAWLGRQLTEWSIVIAARAALRALPLLSRGAGNRSYVAVRVFRATSIALFEQVANISAPSSIDSAAQLSQLTRIMTHTLG
jgi:hypothetical protein